MNTDSALTYGSYLYVEELLQLQHPRTHPPQHDEHLFIILHQAYELWFRQMLHELEATIGHLEADDLLTVSRRFRRIHAIWRLLDGQVDILETMTPQDFNGFREALRPASGFQSAQFREIEFLCGTKASGHLNNFEPGSPERQRLEQRLAEPTLYDALKALLARRGFDIQTPEALIASFRVIYESEQTHLALCMLLEDFIDLDERMILWRARHVRLAERMIGTKPGTAGSQGTRYLQTTLEKKFFPEIWAVRSELGT